MASTFYIDPDRPDDTGVGTSWATAFKNWGGATAAKGVTAGDTIKIKKTPDPVALGVTATFTNDSLTITASSTPTGLTTNHIIAIEIDGEFYPIATIVGNVITLKVKWVGVTGIYPIYYTTPFMVTVAQNVQVSGTAQAMLYVEGGWDSVTGVRNGRTVYASNGTVQNMVSNNTKSYVYISYVDAIYSAGQNFYLNNSDGCIIDNCKSGCGKTTGIGFYLYLFSGGLIKSCVAYAFSSRGVYAYVNNTTAYGKVFATGLLLKWVGNYSTVNGVMVTGSASSGVFKNITFFNLVAGPCYFQVDTADFTVDGITITAGSTNGRVFQVAGIPNLISYKNLAFTDTIPGTIIYVNPTPGTGHAVVVDGTSRVKTNTRFGTVKHNAGDANVTPPNEFVTEILSNVNNLNVTGRNDSWVCSSERTSPNILYRGNTVFLPSAGSYVFDIPVLSELSSCTNAMLWMEITLPDGSVVKSNNSPIATRSTNSDFSQKIVSDPVVMSEAGVVTINIFWSFYHASQKIYLDTLYVSNSGRMRVKCGQLWDDMRGNPVWSTPTEVIQIPLQSHLLPLCNRGIL